MMRLSAALAVMMATNSSAQAKVKRPAVMIVGTFHFKNPGLDAVKSAQRDMRSPERQVEIEEAAVRLAQFRPTVIAVEAEEGHQPINERLQQFLKEGGPLGPGEIEQLAFRIAKRSGLTSLCLADEFHGVGHPAFRTIEQVLTDAEAGGQAASARDLRAHHDQLGKFATKVDSELTVVQLLALYSSPAYTKMTARADLRLGELGAHKTFGGAEWMGAYAARNFRIFAKLRRCLRGPAERMLVIYGSAHRPFLQRAFEDQGDVRLVDPLTVLPSPPKVPLPVLR